MKNLKLFIFVLISLLLSSCANVPSPSPSEKIETNDKKRLNNLNYIPKEQNYEENIKLPAGGKSGDSFNEIDDNNELLSGKDVTILDENYPNKELLGSYSSKVYTKTEDRQKNLRIVCDKLTGTILTPNQEFSYNTTCGPYNKENGFGKATVFLGDGTETQDYGGGVCQLSSTLYNAIKDLNVEVTERHNHSKKVYYVPDGQDATVSYGNLDFKFKNLNTYSLLLEANSNAEAVIVNVYKI